MKRRDFVSAIGASAMFASIGAAQTDFQTYGFQAWYDALVKHSEDLKHGKLSALQWQEAVEKVYGNAKGDDIYHALDWGYTKMDMIRSVSPERGELFRQFNLSTNHPVTGGPRKLITKVAHVQKGRAIPPHGHSNMASAFLVLSGEFEVRQYDKLEDRQDHLVVRQTVHDKRAGEGTWSSISDYKNNVHWLEAKTDDCFILSSKVVGVEEGRKLDGRVNIDLIEAKTLGTDTFLANKITSTEAAELYQ